MRDLLSKKSYISWDKTACLMPNSARRNNAKEFEFERGHLQKLPMYKTTDFSEAVIRVNSTSTIVIKKITYSVPSTDIPHELRVNFLFVKFLNEKIFLPKILQHFHFKIA